MDTNELADLTLQAITLRNRLLTVANDTTPGGLVDHKLRHRADRAADALRDFQHTAEARRYDEPVRREARNV